MSTIDQKRDDIYKLIKESLLPDRYDNNSEFDVFVRLLSEVMGESIYYKDNLPNITDPEECPTDFLPYLARDLGYDIATEVGTEDLRLLIKYYLSLRRRRGTLKSIENAVRYAGRNEIAILGNEEGTEVYVDEVIGEGLYYIEGENVNLDKIEDYLKKVRPAGTKYTYSLRYNLYLTNIDRTVDRFSKSFIGLGKPFIDSSTEINGDYQVNGREYIDGTDGIEELFNKLLGFRAYYGSEKDVLNISVNEISNLVVRDITNDSLNVSLSESSNIDNIFNQNDSLNVSLNESSNVYKSSTEDHTDLLNISVNEISTKKTVQTAYGISRFGQ